MMLVAAALMNHQTPHAYAAHRNVDSRRSSFSRFEQPDGISVRRFYPLDLEPQQGCVSSVGWTIVHRLIKHPLFGVTQEQMLSSSAEFLIC